MKTSIRWFYLSFADRKFLGAAVVKAPDPNSAIERARELGIPAQGEVMIWVIKDNQMHLVPDDMRNRVLTEREVLERLDGERIR